jgi:hypothetical protein
MGAAGATGAFCAQEAAVKLTRTATLAAENIFGITTSYMAGFGITMIAAVWRWMQQYCFDYSISAKG